MCPGRQVRASPARPPRPRARPTRRSRRARRTTRRSTLRSTRLPTSFAVRICGPCSRIRRRSSSTRRTFIRTTPESPFTGRPGRRRCYRRSILTRSAPPRARCWPRAQEDQRARRRGRCERPSTVSAMPCGCTQDGMRASECARKRARCALDAPRLAGAAGAAETSSPVRSAVLRKSSASWNSVLAQRFLASPRSSLADMAGHGRSQRIFRK